MRLMLENCPKLLPALSAALRLRMLSTIEIPGPLDANLSSLSSTMSALTKIVFHTVRAQSLVTLRNSPPPKLNSLIVCHSFSAHTKYTCMAAIGGLASLTHLRLAFPVTDRELDELCGLSQLRSLETMILELNGSAFKQLSFWVPLTDLDCFGALTDEIARGVSALAALQIFKLTSVEIIEPHAVRCLDSRKLNKLREIRLECGGLDFPLLSHLATFPALERLEIALYVGPNESHTLTAANTLHQFDLSLYGFASFVLKQVGALRVHWLRVVDHPVRPAVDDHGLFHIGQIATLQKLILNNAAITDNGLGELSRIAALHSLTLRHCRRVTGSGFASLKRSLRELDCLDCTVCCC